MVLGVKRIFKEDITDRDISESTPKYYISRSDSLFSEYPPVLSVILKYYLVMREFLLHKTFRLLKIKT